MKFGKLFLVTLTALILAIVAFLEYSPKPVEEVHYHAGFIVYIDGVKQDYSDYKYMDLEPCSEHPIKKSAKEEQIEKAHLHDGVGDVVHSHRNGAKWSDLFKNIGVAFPADKMIVGYVNGGKVENILNYSIKAYDSVVIDVGKDDGNHGDQAVTLDHIKEVEAKSELCGTTN